MTATTLLDFGDEPCVLLTTFRANGDRVGTPVWVARDGDHLVVPVDARPTDLHAGGRSHSVHLGQLCRQRTRQPAEPERLRRDHEVAGELLADDRPDR